MIVCPFYLYVDAAMAYHRAVAHQGVRHHRVNAPIRHRRGPQQVDNNSYIRRRPGVPTTGTRQQMAWEWELRATRQASVRYIDGGDSLLSWSAADGAPSGAADLGDALTRPSGERRLAAEIRVLPFHDYKQRLLASPGAMAIPDRRLQRCFARGSASRHFRRRADAVPPPICEATTRARVFGLPGGVGA